MNKQTRRHLKERHESYKYVSDSNQPFISDFFLFEEINAILPRYLFISQNPTYYFEDGILKLKMKNKNQAEKLLAHSEALLTVIEDYVKKNNNTNSIERILLTPEKTEHTKPQNKINEEDREIIISLLNEGYKSTEIIELFPGGKYTWQQIVPLKSSLNTQESDAVLQTPN